MGTGNLVVDASSLDKLAKDVSTKAGEFNDNLSKIKSENEELKTVWQGSDIDSYSQKVKEQALQMDKFYNTLMDISAYMSKVAQNYTNAQETNRSMINK